MMRQRASRHTERTVGSKVGEVVEVDVELDACAVLG